MCCGGGMPLHWYLSTGWLAVSGIKSQSFTYFRFLKRSFGLYIIAALVWEKKQQQHVWLLFMWSFSEKAGLKGLTAFLNASSHVKSIYGEVCLIPWENISNLSNIMSHTEMLMEVQWDNRDGIVPLTIVDMYLSFVYFIWIITYVYVIVNVTDIYLSVI